MWIVVVVVVGFAIGVGLGVGLGLGLEVRGKREEKGTYGRASRSARFCFSRKNE